MDTGCYDKFNFTFLNTNKSITNNYNSDGRFKQETYYNYIQEILFTLYTVIILLLSSETKIFNKIHQYAILNIISTITQRVATKIISLLCLIISVITSPIIFAILLIFNSYRLMVHLILKWQYGHNFAGLLEGTDAIWAIEDVSKSIITILMVIQCDDVVQLHLKLKQKMLKIIHDKRFEKLGFQRDKAYGYYFWRKVEVDVDSNVKYMKPLEDNEIGLNKKILQGLLSKYSNEPMPHNHASSWEMLIGTQPLLNEEEMVTNSYPVVFRFHHSVGDGIALLRLLLEVVDDTNKAEHNRQTWHLLYMNMIQSVDNNIIHGADLTGDKVVAWSVEKKDFLALRAVKQIKAKFPGSSFNDILLTALSESLYRYFKQNTDKIPPSVTVVIPERRQIIFSTEHHGLERDFMENRFSLGMLYLPLLPQTECERELSVLDRLQEVRQQTTFLKNASDYQINYWLLRVVVKILPEYMLRPMLYSTHSTMVMSNIIGPEKVTICDGLSVNDIAFWMPHRGLTGVGFSIISYDKRLELGLNVDRALVSNVEDAQIILDGIFDSIKKLHESIL